MVAIRGGLLGVLALSLVLLPSCTVLRVTSDSDAKGVEAQGLIRGHATLGVSAEDRLVNVRLLGGSNRGAIAEVVLWKLFRLEAGLAGLSVGIGPIHLGLGSLFYRPNPPELQSGDRESEKDEECEEAEETRDSPEAFEEGESVLLRGTPSGELSVHPDGAGLQTSNAISPVDHRRRAA